MSAADVFADRRATIAASDDLSALLERQRIRAAPVLQRMPPVPLVKALLSQDGGTCPEDGSMLRFDPWNPDVHRCPRCGRSWSGPRHHAHWARAQHLWLAERAAQLATLAVLTDDAAATTRARELLAAYHRRYFELPNRDNVLGPSHLFFSTYLESIWILDYIAAAHLLRSANVLDDTEVESVDAIADEAAALIGEFDEGMSNRQTWHAAALTALGCWFDDEELLRRAIESPTGLLGHLTDGFGSDGMWFEGENYHLFAMRGLILGLHWADIAGAEMLDDRELAKHLGIALMAPAASALPDFTFPARQDSRFGMSLAHPAYLECWEAGHAWLDRAEPATLVPWLHALYGATARLDGNYDAYLHEAGEEPSLERRGRSDLSWWALWNMAAELPATAPWTPTSHLQVDQGLAILRSDTAWLSLECGPPRGGHGHPDRLQLSLFADGVHWLPDAGTGSYVTGDLFWYRSTLAHNAPRLDGVDQPGRITTWCAAYDTAGAWQWVVGRWGNVERRVVLGPGWALDVLEAVLEPGQLLELPWHGNGAIGAESRGTWPPADWEPPFVHDARRFAPDQPGAVHMSIAHGSAALQLWMLGHDELLRAEAPGLPGGEDAVFLVQRATGPHIRFVTVLDRRGTVTGVDVTERAITVHEDADTTTIEFTPGEAVVRSTAGGVTLGGSRPAPRPLARILTEQPMLTTGHAVWNDTTPALDGTLDGFDTSAPLLLDDEHQYFRSEDPYPGAEEFSASAYVNWDQDGFFLAVEVTKSDVVVRPPDAAPLRLDNEPDDLNCDGVQVYYRIGRGDPVGYLIRPGPDGTVIARHADGASRDDVTLRGGWRRTPAGYALTAALPCSGLHELPPGTTIRFDLLVNEMRSERFRRAGQLVWSGGPGWIYLRGDRHDSDQFGVLELL